MENGYEILDMECIQYFGWQTCREDLGIDWKVILQWTFRKLGGKVWTGCIWLRIWTNAEEFLDWLSDY